MKEKTLFKIFISIFMFIIMFIFAFNYIIDPFNFNNKFKLGLNKDKISYKMNYRLYKIIEYKNNKCENILLGDSRTDALSIEDIKKVSGENYYNFAYGGGTLQESIDSFWYAASLSKLKNVYIGISFNLFSDNNNMNLIEEAKSIISLPLNYYLNSFILKVSIYNCYYRLTNNNLYNEEPSTDKEGFWNYQLGPKVTGLFYEKYKWPENYIKELKEIKRYCNENDINLVFWIPPTHIDLQNKVKEYHLEKEYSEYKKALKSISKVIDFDTYNEITIDKENYKDPYHFNNNIMRGLVRKIWANN